jgi:glycosyltransferase involved in cell wall biosynthesis
MTPRATVIVPTFNHGPLLLRSVRSALQQTIQDIEILIAGDGVTDATRQAAAELIRDDPRVRFLDYPKAAQWGQENRARALSEARASAICYLPDDDLWLPTHVETMLGLLDDADFAHALPILAHPDRTFDVWTLDLSLAYHRNLLLQGVARVGIGGTAHRAAVYGRLPRGWRTVGPGAAPIMDLWQQAVRLPGCRVASGTQPTVIRFHTAERATWSLDQRVAEVDYWVERLATPSGREQFVAQVLDTVVRDRARQDARLHASVLWWTRVRLLNAWRTRVSWATGVRLKRLPVVGRLIAAAGRALFGPVSH